MIELTPLEFGMCLGLTAAVFAFAAYWYMRFFRVLRLDRRARGAELLARDLREFASDVMDLGLAGSSSQALGEFGRRVLDALHRKAPGAQCWWVSRAGGSSEAFMSCRGGAGAPPPVARLDAATLEDPALREGSIELGTGAAARHPLLERLAGSGVTRARIVTWGRPGASRGLLAVGWPSQPNGKSESIEHYLGIVKSHASALAAIVDELARLSQSQRSLEGGLSSTIEDLTNTHMRLIEKTRRIKALEDVASTISAHGPQAQPALSAIVSIVARFLDADLVAFLLLDDSTGELVVHPSSHGLEGSEMFYRVPVSELRSSSVRVFKTGKPFISGDAQNDPNVLPSHARLWNVHSLLVVPLAVEGRSLGVIRVGKRGKDAFAPEAVGALQVIAKEAAVIVETAMLNRKLSQSAEQLIALNRMKDDFVSTVSHEFKTPLTSILGFITVILDGDAGEVNEQQKKFLTIARTAARRLTGLVSDLLDLSKLEGGVRMDLQASALGPLMIAASDGMKPQFVEADKALNLGLPARLPKVVCDERWIRLALDNLLSNAFKFTKPGGEVRVWAADKGEFVMVCVADDGIGIPPEERERVFEKFYRASNRGEVQAPGTGLGLAIVKEIVTKHGGKVWVESDPGRETKFCFVLKTARHEQDE